MATAVGRGDKPMYRADRLSSVIGLALVLLCPAGSVRLERIGPGGGCGRG